MEDSNMLSDHHLDDDDEEEECRVCRGPAEEGRPLYKPCKCSGSIGLTHQDCLQSWLRVQRGNGSCELCKTPFRFSPQYAESAPDKLPALQVFLGLARSFVARWLPFLLRILFAASLWLIVAPVVTAYLYLGWMNRPSIIMERFTWKLFMTDLVSGAVVAAYIIISFLSIMSFADFLRVEWHQRGLGPMVRNNQRREFRGDPPAPREEDIDNGIWLNVQQEIIAQPRGLRAHHNDFLDMAGHGGSSDDDNDDPDYHDGDSSGERIGQGDNDDDEDDNASDDSANEDDEFVPDFDSDDEDADMDADDEDNEPDREPAMHFAQAQREERRDADNRNDARLPVDRPFDFDPDDNVDVDINIALDELLGVRGPLGAVIRNLLWLLAFNAVYVGFFCFIPRTVGTAVSSLFFNTTFIGAANKSVTSNLTETFSVAAIVSAVDAESEQHQTVFRLHDLATVTLGYLACAAAAWVGRLLWLMSQRIGFFAAQGRRTGHVELDEMREVMDEMNRIVNGHAVDGQLGDDPPGVALHMAVGVALEAMMAIVKVGVLLFLKMFLLPIILGLCLDASVASVFGFKIEDRIAYAGRDLFSFILLHWVCGITFMLLVTVSVLQLREVAHPDLLSQIIRPQEPQPDLLGNLMHESVGTHAKRMALSLVIYAVLWAMHVYFPARLLVASGLLDNLFFWELKLSYVITPKLQVPFELLFFHLCMLALLERYKNGLGEMQHHWLKHLTKAMGIRECVLPMKVEAFKYFGTRAVFQEERVVDPFWYSLAKGEFNVREELLDAQCMVFRPVLDSPNGQSPRKEGVTKEDGQRFLTNGADYIRLPYFLPGRALRSRSTLLPTKIGKYRLARDVGGEENVIHLWREVAGAPIPRPPEGWDDLGVEPPDVQGRWAYGREKKSAIEGGVARRRPLFAKDQGWVASIPVCLKLSVLLVFSWLATTLLLCAAVAIPPAVGRLIFFILRVPDRWIHDPLAFGLGFVVALRPFAVLARTIVSSEDPLWRRIASWILRFRFPSAFKASVLVRAFVLYFVVAPLFIGIAYDLTFVKSTDLFMRKEPLVDQESLIMDWATGTLLLYVWSFLCIRGVLTRRFRVFIMEGRELPEDGNPGDAQAAAWQDAGGGRIRLTWQGNHGRMARFWDVWNAVFLNWEWDMVDPTTLLHDVAVPVTTELFWTMITPLATALIYELCFPNLSDLTRVIGVRLVIAIVSCTQIARVWRDQLTAWFEFAHKSARDDLYLIGERLMNYGE